MRNAVFLVLFFFQKVIRLCFLERAMAEIEPYVVVVTCVVLSRADKKGTRRALILKRSKDEKEGPCLWTIPGGTVERADWGEPVKTASGALCWQDTLARAMAREVREETDIAAPPHKFLLSLGKEVVFIRKSGVPTLVFLYVLQYEGAPAIRLDSGATEYRWVSTEEIDAYPFIGNVREDIKETLRGHSTLPSSSPSA